MAERMIADLPHWEKSGNTTWVECPRCNKWFPVDPRLAASDTIKMVCFNCTASFLSKEAARIV